MKERQTTRKKSILYSHAAWKIETESPSQHHILLFLSAVADASGVSFHSYTSIMTKTGYCRYTVCNALKYLRDVLKVLAWESGHGNQHTKQANRYILNLQKMTALAESAQSARQTKRKSAQSGLTSAQSGLAHSGKSGLASAQSGLASGKSGHQTLRSHTIRKEQETIKSKKGSTGNSEQVFEEPLENLQAVNPQEQNSTPDSLTYLPPASKPMPPELAELPKEFYRAPDGRGVLRDGLTMTPDGKFVEEGR